MKTQLPLVKTPQNVPQLPTFTTNHHKKKPPLKNEEDTTLSTIFINALLEIKKYMEVYGEFAIVKV